MWQIARRVVVCFIACAAAAPEAAGQFVSLRRFVNVEASAPHSGVPTVVDDPPPVVRDPDFFGPISSSASAVNPGQIGSVPNSASTSGTSTWSPDRLDWTASGSVSTRPAPGLVASATGSSAALIDVLAPTTFRGTLSSVTSFNFTMSAAVLDSSGNTLISRSTALVPQQFDLTLQPAQYTVRANWFALTTTGNGGGGAAEFSFVVIPEPATCALALGLTAWAIGARRRRRGVVQSRVHVRG